MTTSNKEGLLTQPMVKELLSYDPETGILTWKIRRGCCKAGTAAGSLHGEGYRVVEVNGYKYLSHRLIWLLVTGNWPENEVDHVGLNRADNRWVNLREATRSQNMHNTTISKVNISGIKGVHWDKRSNRWISRIGLNRKRLYLGSFTSKEDAGEAYSKAAKEIAGDFARLN